MVRALNENAMVKLIHGNRFTPFSLCNKLGARALLESASFEQGRGGIPSSWCGKPFPLSTGKMGYSSGRAALSSPLESKGRDILDHLLSFADQHGGTELAFPFPAGASAASPTTTPSGSTTSGRRRNPISGARTPTSSSGTSSSSSTITRTRSRSWGSNYREHRIDLERAIGETRGAHQRPRFQLPHQARGGPTGRRSSTRTARENGTSGAWTRCARRSSRGTSSRGCSRAGSTFVRTSPPSRPTGSSAPSTPPPTCSTSTPGSSSSSAPRPRST